MISIDKNKTVCFTGHRKINKEVLMTLPNEIEMAIKQAIQKGYNTFLSGGAVGFDLQSALIVLKLKKIYLDIRLILILPCNKKDMSKKWTDKEISLFNFVCENADDVVFVSDEHFDGCMKNRNKKLVELSSYCIAYYTKYRSGTGQTIRMMAKSINNLENIINLSKKPFI